MTVTLDTGYDEDTTETKIDFAPTPNAFRFGGREVEREIKLNSTDEKTGWVTRKTMSQPGGGSVEAGVHISMGPGKETQTTGYIQGQYNDNKGNYVKINADMDKKGNTEIDIGSGCQFGKKQGK